MGDICGCIYWLVHQETWVKKCLWRLERACFFLLVLVPPYTLPSASSCSGAGWSSCSWIALRSFVLSGGLLMRITKGESARRIKGKKKGSSYVEARETGKVRACLVLRISREREEERRRREPKVSGLVLRGRSPFRRKERVSDIYIARIKPRIMTSLDRTRRARSGEPNTKWIVNYRRVSAVTDHPFFYPSLFRICFISFFFSFTSPILTVYVPFWGIHR